MGELSPTFAIVWEWVGRMLSVALFAFLLLFVSQPAILGGGNPFSGDRREYFLGIGEIGGNIEGMGHIYV